MSRKAILVAILITVLCAGNLAQAREADLDKAWVLFLKGDYKGTLRECQTFLNQSPQDRLKDDIYYLMGLAFLKMGSYKEARENFEIITLKNKRSNLADYACLGLADTYFLEGNFEEALKRYRKVLLEYPKSAALNLVMFRLGQCYQKKGDFKQAKYYFRRLQANYPLSFEAKEASELLKRGLYFTIQVGAFKEKSNALALEKELLRKGYKSYKPYIEEVPDKEKFYRVRAGKFNSKLEAESLQEELRNDGYTAKIHP